MKRELLERSIILDAADRDGARAPSCAASGLDARRSTRRASSASPYAGDTAQELIARIRTPLSVLRVHEPSLEEAYVELLREPGGGRA